eukprot:2666123-Rhodomonas_salina.1
MKETNLAKATATYSRVGSSVHQHPNHLRIPTNDRMFHRPDLLLCWHSIRVASPIQDHLDHLVLALQHGSRQNPPPPEHHLKVSVLLQDLVQALAEQGPLLCALFDRHPRRSQ